MREVIEAMDNNTLASHLDWLRMQMIYIGLASQEGDIDSFLQVVAERLRSPQLHVVK